MDESLKLLITQKQQQTLAPMQLQLVRMLEMSGPEVEDEVRRAVDDNPALEVSEDDRDSVVSDDIPYYRLDTSNRSADDDVYEPVAVAHSQSLIEFLMSQLTENSDLSERDMQIAGFVVGNIDDNGYMTRSMLALVDDIAIQGGLDVDVEEVRRVWNVVRQLDPAGVGAVDLRDSLLLQLQRRQRSEAVVLAIEIVRDYFDLFSLMHFQRIGNLTGSTEDQLRAAMEIIRGLNPKPGAQIGGGEDDRTRQISPDFMVEVEGEQLTLTLLNRIPRLQIEQSFSASTVISPQESKREADVANAFIKQKRDEAASFIKVLEMRQQTLFRVMSAIMQWQRDFFLSDDPMTLKPMILKDISAVTGDDISVISRVTTGKYVATRQGVYPLKFFFNERRKESDDISLQVVLGRLREIIEEEDKDKPLSDAAITELLQSEGFDIARRTVAKYRERLGLPVGRLRRKI